MQQIQRPYITVDVLNGNVDKAWRSLNRQVQEEGFLETAKAQQVFMKPSERRKLDKRASQQKLRQQEFRWAVAQAAGSLCRHTSQRAAFCLLHAEKCCAGP